MKESMAAASKIRDRLAEGLRAKISDMVINSPEQTGEREGMCCPYIFECLLSGNERRGAAPHPGSRTVYMFPRGSACSSNKKGQSHVLKAMGLTDREIEGTLRFSFGQMNDIDEIDVVTEKVAAAVKRFREVGKLQVAAASWKRPKGLCQLHDGTPMDLYKVYDRGEQRSER